MHSYLGLVRQMRNWSSLMAYKKLLFRTVQRCLGISIQIFRNVCTDLEDFQLSLISLTQRKALGFRFKSAPIAEMALNWMAVVWSVSINTAHFPVPHFPLAIAIMEWWQCSLSCTPGGLLQTSFLGSMVAAVGWTLSHEHSIAEEGQGSCRSAQLQKQSCTIISKAHLHSPWCRTPCTCYKAEGHNQSSALLKHLV